MLVAMFTRNKKTIHRPKQKESKCKLDNWLVLSDKNLPQCTVGNLSVVCTIHHFADTKKDTTKTPTISDV